MVQLAREIADRWGIRVIVEETTDGRFSLACPPELLAAMGAWLFQERGFAYAGLVAGEEGDGWVVRHLMAGLPYRVELLCRSAPTERAFPSISSSVPAADWHEREATNRFGLAFYGLPAAGELLPAAEIEPSSDQRMLAHGAFLMPVGPVFSDVHEPVHFEIASEGENMARICMRLGYKHRAVEQRAEGQAALRAVLLVERTAATTAFSHALGFCRALEAIAALPVPARAHSLRMLLAELERLRHHAGAIRKIVASTALIVAESQFAILEEDLLRLCGRLGGHRYLFGVCVPGGLAGPLEDRDCQQAATEAITIARRLEAFCAELFVTSSFLDRLEEVGAITTAQARELGFVGPIARASGIDRDLRRDLPYGPCDDVLVVPTESEGDGYARLRVLAAEALQSARLAERLANALPPGPVYAQPVWRAGDAWGWSESPRGASYHWVRLESDGTIRRWHFMPPSFANWRAFPIAAEHFAYQDFPIILASLAYSVAEHDR